MYQIWLGGDICSETSREQSTMYYLENLFCVSSDTTHFALGNYDMRNGNLHYITDVTQRPTCYTSTFNGITLMVLNTNFGHMGVYDTIQMKMQFEMIENVCDSIENSSHLIILSHHVFWGLVEGINYTWEMQMKINQKIYFILVRISNMRMVYSPSFKRLLIRELRLCISLVT
ncbi:MAG: hypothetical protein ACI8YO_001935 [Gammaproteobacteria bacterium]|jgi:hypothetical protein